MAKKIFTDESLATFVDEIKTYTDETVSTSTLSSANTYTDNAVAQKSQVQIITWEADD